MWASIWEPAAPPRPHRTPHRSTCSAKLRHRSHIRISQKRLWEVGKIKGSLEGLVHVGSILSVLSFKCSVSEHHQHRHYNQKCQVLVNQHPAQATTHVSQGTQLIKLQPRHLQLGFIFLKTSAGWLLNTLNSKLICHPRPLSGMFILKHNSPPAPSFSDCVSY